MRQAAPFFRPVMVPGLQKLGAICVVAKYFDTVRGEPGNMVVVGNDHV
jgi:hypothetical protein